MGRTTTDNVLHSSHWALIDSLDSGQTEDDVSNSKPINPELDDTDLLTGEFIQHCLTKISQLVALGILAIHALVTTLPMFRSAPRKLQSYVKMTINFHWIQSN